MKKLFSFLLTIILVFVIYIPKATYAEEVYQAKNADEIINLINNLKVGESIIINVDSDMDFSGVEENQYLRHIEITQNNNIVINNISNKELQFKNVSIYGTAGSSIYFGDKINIYGDISDDNIETLFNNALFVQGDSGNGGPKVTINGDVTGTKGSKYSTNVIYARFGAEVIVNGNIIGFENASGVLADGYSIGNKIIKTKVIINGNINSGNNMNTSQSGGDGATVANGAELIVNGNIIAGDGYYGGNGVCAYTRFERFKSSAIINGNVYGGNGVSLTGVKNDIIGYNLSYGYALYADEYSCIEYLGIIQGGKLGENNVQKNCYEYGDIGYHGKVLAGDYIYSGTDYDKITYKTHVQDYGWQDWVSNGEISGTSGESKRLEGIEINLENSRYSGNINYKTHVQDYGWQEWSSNGEVSGTSGESKRLEAIAIRLTGELSENYDIYYRVHAQDYGWLGWTKNGESAGTEGLSKRLEALEIILIKKGEQVPGNTESAFIKM